MRRHLSVRASRPTDRRSARARRFRTPARKILFEAKVAHGKRPEAVQAKGLLAAVVHFVQIFGFFDGLALSCRFILFGPGLFVEFGDFASEVQGQF